MAVRTPALVVLSLTLIAVSSARGAAYVISSVGDAPTPRTAGSAPRPIQEQLPTPHTADPLAALVMEAEAENAAQRSVNYAPATDYTAMASIYAGLPPQRAATLIAGLPREDGAGLLAAMPQGSAGAVMAALDDETAIALTLALTHANGAP